MVKKLWGGRFSKKTEPLVEEFTKSIHYDYKLAAYDVIGSGIHIQVLKKAGLVTPLEANRLDIALQGVYRSIKNGTFKLNRKSEDIHTNIQNILYQKVGDLALKLHTARSRNDQVVFATKFYSKNIITELNVDIKKLVNSVKTLVAENKNVIIPGFTHMQHAQPVYLKDYLSVYIVMLNRDLKRLANINESIHLTMGAGALAGTPIDANKYNEKTPKTLKAIGVSEYIEATTNSLDAVSDRDFIIDILSALSIISMHLSRIAEDLIIWSTKEFNFIEIDEAFCTGSSLMPQKKNPDVLELVRGYSGRLYGNLISVLAMMKGLPLTYNRDMQLDKEPLFNSFEIVSSELKVLAGLIKTLQFNKAKIEESLEDESLYATDLVYYLVNRGIPFTKAHTIIGKLIKYSIDNSIEIKTMTQHELQRFSNKFIKKEIIKLFNPKVSVESKKSIAR